MAIKLEAIPVITAQGVGFTFSGLPSFRERWFSWAYIGAAVLRIEGKVEIADSCRMPAMCKTQEVLEIGESTNSDDMTNSEVLLYKQNLKMRVTLCKIASGVSHANGDAFDLAQQVLREIS